MQKALFVAVTIASLLPACVTVERRTGDDGSGNGETPAGACASTSSYPVAAEGDSTLYVPDVTLEGVNAEGDPISFATRTFYEPCAKQERFLVLRLSAAWCGSCQWHRDHTKELLSSSHVTRVTFVDVLVRDRNNDPADKAALAEWTAATTFKTNVVLGPALSPTELDRTPGALPLVAIVDRKTMAVRVALHDPAPELVRFHLDDLVARADDTARPTYPTLPLIDGRFTAKEWDQVKAMTPLGPLPKDPTNAVADDPRAAALGEQLFNDKGLDPDNQIACVGCHSEQNHFASPSVVLIGKGQGDRNTPTVFLTAYSPWLFWDGRADSQWMQALGPFENVVEIGSTRLFVVHQIATRYKTPYEALFGAIPAMTDVGRFPAQGKPGDASWNAMTEQDRTSVNRVYSNVGKAIAAFERAIEPGQNALDRYASGDSSAMTAPQKDGLLAFLRAGCVQCHHGPRMTDDAFHVVRFPTGRKDNVADVGREDGLKSLAASEFRRDGIFSDAPTGAKLPPSAATNHGAFKTPALRGVAQTEPYGHGGTLATLDDVLEVYAKQGLEPSDPRSTGTAEPWLVPFGDASRAEIRAFLEVLTITPEH